MHSADERSTAERSGYFSVRLIRLAILLAGFSLYTALYGVMSDMIQRSLHLGLVLVLVYLGALASSSLRPATSFAQRLLSVALAVCGLAVMLYHVVFFNEIADRFGELTGTEFYLGIAATIILLEATRRAIGWPIVILAIVFLLYAYFG